MMSLFGFTFLCAALVVFTVAAAKTASPQKDKNAQEQEAVGNIEEVEKISDAEKFGTCEKPDNAAEYQQGAKNAGSPAQVIGDCTNFHNQQVLVSFKVN
jgi:hypothetical protein